jgi:hypothetical protein
MTTSSVLGLLVLSAYATLGAAIVRLVLGHRDGLALVGLSIPIGGGILSWGLFLVSWAGLPLTPLSCLVIWAILTASALSLQYFSPSEASIQRRQPLLTGSRFEQALSLAAWILTGLAIGVALYRSVGIAYGSWDAAAGWAIKGYGIAREGTVFAATRWGAWGLAYPLNIPIQIGLFQMYGNDLLPVSKALFPMFLTSLGIGGYRFWRRQTVAQPLSSLSMLFIVSVPLIFLHGTQGYANLPLTAYLVQAVLWAVVGLGGADRRALTMSGLLFGLAAWTRPEATGYCVVAVLGLAISFRLSGKSGLPIVGWLTPLLLIGGSWLVFGWNGMYSNNLGGGAIKAWYSAALAGDWHLRQLYLIPRLLYDRALVPTRWGALFPVAAVLVLLRLHKIVPRRHPEIFALVVNTALVSLVPIGLFYLQSYTHASDFITILNRSFDRAFFPAASLMIITAVRMYADETVGSDRLGVGGEQKPIGSPGAAE